MVKESVDRDRLFNKLLAGLLLGSGVSAVANTVRDYRSLKDNKDDETDDKSIVITLPKTAESAFDSFRNAKPGLSRYSDSCRPRDTKGRFTGKTEPEQEAVPVEKEAQESDKSDPRGSVMDRVTGVIGLAGGSLLAYELTNTLYDKWRERRLKRQLAAAQEAYVSAISGNSKRAEVIESVLSSASKYVYAVEKRAEEPEAQVSGHGLLSSVVDGVVGAGRAVWDGLPQGARTATKDVTSAVILLSLAGTGATAYVTKKLLDREFPEDKLKKSPVRPTRIVFKTAEYGCELMAGAPGEEKRASAEECAGLLAAMPIYMDVVEGAPSRTLSPGYVKLAESIGTDPAGLMKLAESDFGRLLMTILRNPRALWQMLMASKFGFADNAANKALGAVKDNPEVFGALTSNWASRQNSPFASELVSKLSATPEGRNALVYLHGDRSRPALGGITAADSTLNYLRGLPAEIRAPLGSAVAAVLSRPTAPTAPAVTPSAPAAAVKAPAASPAAATAPSARPVQPAKTTPAAPAAPAATGSTPATPAAGGNWATGMWKSLRDFASGRLYAGSVKSSSVVEDVVAGGSLAAAIPSLPRLGRALRDEEAESAGDETDDASSRGLRERLLAAAHAVAGRRKINIVASDPEAGRYVSANMDKIRKVLARLNAQGDI